MGRRPTLKEIAERSGFSVSKIWRALHRPDDKSTDAVAIRQVADDLGYVSPSAKRRASANHLGIVIPGVSNPAYADWLERLCEKAEDRDFSVSIRITEGKRELAAIENLVRRGVAGLILVRPRASAGKLGSAIPAEIPTVLINASMTSIPSHFASLEASYAEGAMEVADYLFNLGRTSIGYLGGLLNNPAATTRLMALQAALVERGIELKKEWTIRTRQVAPSDYAWGHAQCGTLLQRGLAAPLAIVAYNDVVAIGAMRRLADDGIAVPSSAVVIGFDDVALSSFTIPRLTTIAVDREQMTGDALELLSDAISQSANLSGQVHRVPTRAVFRESAPLDLT